MFTSLPWIYHLIFPTKEKTKMTRAEETGLKRKGRAKVGGKRVNQSQAETGKRSKGEGGILFHLIGCASVFTLSCQQGRKIR